MPAIADTDEEMQESAPAFLDAVVQASKERLANQKQAVQPAQAEATKLRRRSKSSGKECEQEEDKRIYIAALPDGEREKGVEAPEKFAEQETSRRSVAAHMSGQQGTSNAYMHDCALSWLSLRMVLITCVAQAGTPSRLLQA
jgi:hypothetical protein